jgi:hypothetical protein
LRQTLTPELGERLAAIALGHVTREYPNKLDHVLAAGQDVRAPSALHPIFYGSFDWHSCVHGYWLLARLLRRFPASARAAEIAELFDRQLTPEKVARECAYLAAPTARGFERPYGWAWLLKLAAELSETSWSHALTPLAQAFAQRFREFLPRSGYAVRVGTHSSSAFALRLAGDYAQTHDDDVLLALLAGTAGRWFAGDVDCPAWGEPGGEDFLSPALVEAEALRRLWPQARFRSWFDGFFPHLGQRRPAALFAPAEVADRSDGRIAHLDGLNLSRAWCFRALAQALDDERSTILAEAADAHLAASLPYLDADYMGGHWLASFALLALDE